ncbi:hypothetical protein E3Q06_01577 [Wallemia mellicola]|uniref:Zinc finger C2H2 LYAR-type domain-containing protein n=1 Tax=Wallemia mellicola TaxID=1708541 RepID=A0AB38MXE7_9BASI|nr:hypothetical protein E3Q07_01657 [Wallemia mellicola]TIC50001.1 hypothetical protein E3Q06_01577 [Wallemia mellicola]TIC66913.1 hypothetical protein E3Q02_01668 [Wallemia mellicola]
MVSFYCQNCNDTVKKPKLAVHMNRCQAPVDCIDCSTTFDTQTAKSHTSCMTEEQKYQKNLYQKPNKQTIARLTVK